VQGCNISLHSGAVVESAFLIFVVCKYFGFIDYQAIFTGSARTEGPALIYVQAEALCIERNLLPDCGSCEIRSPSPPVSVKLQIVRSFQVYDSSYFTLDYISVNVQCLCCHGCVHKSPQHHCQSMSMMSVGKRNNFYCGFGDLNSTDFIEMVIHDSGFKSHLSGSKSISQRSYCPDSGSSSSTLLKTWKMIIKYILWERIGLLKILPNSL
jgi:hypothetical protein